MRVEEDSCEEDYEIPAPRTSSIKCQKQTQKPKMPSTQPGAPQGGGRKCSRLTCILVHSAILLLLLLLFTCSLITCQVLQQQQQAASNNNKQLLSSLFINQLLSPAINRTAALALLARHHQQQLLRPNTTLLSATSQPVINSAKLTPASSAAPENLALAPLAAPPLPAARSSATGNSSLTAVRLKWRQMEQSIGGWLNSISSQLRDLLSEVGGLDSKPSGEGVSTGCRLALGEFVDALDSQQLWASQMLDASARLPSGMLEGTLTELGNFDQCLAISHQLSRAAGASSAERSLSGQYCSVLVKPHLTSRPRLHTVCQRLPALSATTSAVNQTSWRLLSQNSHQFYYVGLRLGLCAPSKCSRADLQLLLTNHLARYELVAQVKSCQVSATQQEKLDFVQQAIVSLLAALIVLAAVGTSMDYLSERGAAAATDQHLKSRRAAGHDLQPVAACSKRATTWHEYQVYQSSESSSKSQPADSDLSLSTQFNPLVAMQRVKQPPASTVHTDNCFTGVFSDKTKPAIAVLSDSDNEHFKELWLRRLRSEQPETGAGSINKSPKGNTVAAHLAALLSCFSIRRNLSLIGKHVSSSSSSEATTTTTTANEKGDIRVIHGLRTLTMVWIIFGHTIGLVSPEMMNNLFSLAHLSCSSRVLQAMLNATLAVNTFFMLSGLVTVTSFARKCKSALPLIAKSNSLPAEAGSRQQQVAGVARTGSQDCDQDSASIISSLSSSASSNRCIGRSATTGVGHGSRKQSPASSHHRRTMDTWWPADFQPLLWLAARYLRLTPAYAATIGLAVLLPALGSGPFWQDAATSMGSACRLNWWLNLLYVNNFVETDKLCLIHSWYLSNDCQFFCVAMLLFAIFYKSRRAALLLFITLIIASSAITFAVTVANEFPPTIVTTSPAIAERWLFIHSLYYKPWPHLSSYLVGLCTGYLIVQRGDRKQLSAGWRRFAWILWLLVGLSLLNSIYPWNMGLQVEPHLAGLHSATFRTLWAMCSGWLVFALVTSPKNALGRLLSWHGFQVSSRLTYCAYLVHPLLIYYHLGTLRERMDSSLYGQTHRFVATLGLSYLFALLLSLLVESPSIQLQRLLCKARRDLRNQVNQNHSEPVPSTRRTGLQAQRLGHPNEQLSSTSSSSSSHSWSASSSFSEPPLEARELQVSPGAHHEPQVGSNGSALEKRQVNPTQAGHSHTCLAHPERPAIIPSTSQPSTSGECCNALSSAAAASLAAQTDADFQRKLAQAIGRGFRLRSKLASGDTMRQVRRASQVKRLPDDVPVFGVLSSSSSSRVERPRSAAQVAQPLMPNKRPIELGTFKQQQQHQKQKQQPASRQQAKQPQQQAKRLEECREAREGHDVQCDLVAATAALPICKRSS